MRLLPLRKLLTLTALLLIASSVFAAPHALAQSPVRDFGSEAGFLSSLNSQRSAGGLPPLTLNSSMTAAADGWALAMANGSFLAHAGDIVSGTPGGWTKVGENVGRGQTVSSLTTAFMNSAGHRANIMDPSYTHIGISVYVHPTDGRIYTTHRFAALNAPAPAPTVAPVVVEAPAPTPIPPAPVPLAPEPEPTLAPAPTPIPPTPTPEPEPEPTLAPAPTPVPPTPTPEPEPTLAPVPATPEPAADFGTPPEQLAFVDEGPPTSEATETASAAKLASKTAKLTR